MHYVPGRLNSLTEDHLATQRIIMKVSHSCFPDLSWIVTWFLVSQNNSIIWYIWLLHFFFWYILHFFFLFVRKSLFSAMVCRYHLFPLDIWWRIEVQGPFISKEQAVWNSVSWLTYPKHLKSPIRIQGHHSLVWNESMFHPTMKHQSPKNKTLIQNPYDFCFVSTVHSLSFSNTSFSKVHRLYP